MREPVDVRRAIRKVVANALASSPETAMDPGKVTLKDIETAARRAKQARESVLTEKRS